MILWRWALLVGICGLLVLTGCADLPYYAQSVNGHMNIVAAGQPIDRLADDPRQTEALRDRLGLAQEIRQFAIAELALPDNKSYRNYVDTGQQFVTWSVFAAPELSADVRTWCFPVMGCVPYRGYFSKEAAEKFAEEVKTEGLDVHVGGVPAYSTLGLTTDPLLNTMLLYGEDYLAGVIFHELSHQRVYISGDTQFNEAFAVSVERAGTEKWLRMRGKNAMLRDYQASERRNRDFIDLIVQTRSELKTIYEGAGNEAQKRAAKQAAIERLRARYRQVKRQRWGGYDGYDQWFEAPINNAKLATVSVYNDLEPAFSRLLKMCGGDFERYYQAVGRIGALGHDARRAALLDARACE